LNQTLTSDEKRARLVDQIAAIYDYEQLRSAVSSLIGKKLDHYVIASGLKMTIVVDKLIDELQRTDTETWYRFALRLRESTNRPELRNAIDVYLGIVESHGNIYHAPEALGKKFIDRTNLGERLKELFDSDNQRVLLVRGPSGLGRTHSKWRIQHVAQKLGIQMVYINLMGDKIPSTTSVTDIILRLFNRMRLPIQDFKDRVQQDAGQAQTFVDTLIGLCSQEPLSAQKWCIVFDDYDRKGVDKAVMKLVDDLLKAAADQEIRPIWTISLGHPATSLDGALTEEFEPLTRALVEEFLEKMAALGRTVPADKREEILINVFGKPQKGVDPPPLTDPEKLCLLVEKLKTI